MTTIDIAPAPSRARTVLSRVLSLAGALRGFAASLHRDIELRDAERRLHGLSDHMLRDMGICRSDIHHRVRGLD